MKTTTTSLICRAYCWADRKLSAADRVLLQVFGGYTTVQTITAIATAIN